MTKKKQKNEKHTLNLLVNYLLHFALIIIYVKYSTELFQHWVHTYVHYDFTIICCKLTACHYVIYIFGKVAFTKKKYALNLAKLVVSTLA